MGIRMATPMSASWPMNDAITVHVRLVFPPPTNVCSNILPLPVDLAARVYPSLGRNFYFTAFTDPLRRASLAGLSFAGATPAGLLFRWSNQLCQNRTMGLATNTEE